MYLRVILAILGGAFLWSCHQAEEAPLPLVEEDILRIPAGFPSVEFPEGNEFTVERWELGKSMFFDSSLSRDSSVSCASCHHPNLSFSDNRAFSLGVDQSEGTRNSPSLANVAYHPYFTREGGVPTLEMQIFVPIQEHNEFDFNMVLLAERLAQSPYYADMAERAYDRPMDAFVITRALATFERSLISGQSRYDQYATLGMVDALNPLEKAGMELFFGDRAACYHCHAGFNFTDYSFENNGLYEAYPDQGRMRLTGLEEDRARFKVPSLRNIEVTAPYMHDGSLLTLEDVVEHYDQGGFGHPNQSKLIRPLYLTEQEKEELVAFLRSLTDEAFLQNPLFQE